VSGEPAVIRTRRGSGTRRAPAGSASGGGYARTALLPARWTGRIITAQSPGLIPRTSAVMATGPLPGTIPSTVSSCANVSAGCGFPATPARRPENLIVALKGSPFWPGSSQ
jgi:hypothetical protein